MLRRPETQKVAEFLYDLLVARAPTNDYAKRVAERMGVPYPSLARYWQGKAVFPAGLVRPLFLATDQDMRVAEFFLLDGCEYRLERVQASKTPDDFARALMSIAQLEGEVSGIYLSATQDESEAGNRISFGEARLLEEALRKLTRIVEELRALIRKEHLEQG
jgi:hypothetical protein